MHDIHIHTKMGLVLQSLVTEDGELKLMLKEEPIPDPGATDVVVKVEATPINPSDQATLIFPANVDTGETTGNGCDKVYTAKLKDYMRNAVKPRIGKGLRSGNEGSGVVVKAGKSEAAQALLGKRVAVLDGSLFCQYRKVSVSQCVALHESTSAEEGASCFVNPLTALGMVETMKMDGFKAIIHTAAASNLGQMLNRVCLQDGVDLINIVRKPEQANLLRSMGAKYVCDSSEQTFKKDLINAIDATQAFLAFDATGGGHLASTIFSCMEASASKNPAVMGAYGSNVRKNIYIYGGLDPSQTVLTRNFGFSWGLNGWLLFQFLERIGKERESQLLNRVVDEIGTTFASHYTRSISLEEALDKNVVEEYSKQATGEKFLIKPNEG